VYTLYLAKPSGERVAWRAINDTSDKGQIWLLYWCRKWLFWSCLTKKLCSLYDAEKWKTDIV